MVFPIWFRHFSTPEFSTPEITEKVARGYSSKRVTAASLSRVIQKRSFNQ
jgi:hypothetical protein